MKQKAIPGNSRMFSVTINFSTVISLFPLGPNVKDIRAGIWPNLWVKKVVLFSFNNKIFYI